MQDNNQQPPRGTFKTVATSLLALVVLSLLPWGDFTGGVLKDFNLLGDLMPERDRSYTTHEELDPELARLHESSGEAIAGMSPAVVAAQPSDSDSAQPLSEVQLVITPDDMQAPRAEDGSVLIEDYSDGGRALAAVAAGLHKAASGGLYRIAVIGDSYIEGDIFTQDIRSQLQDSYGGRGVGYMAAYSAFPGFRQSVSQSGDGWTATEIRKMHDDDYRCLQGIYYTSDGSASASFKGTHKPAHSESWSESTLLFIAPATGTVTVTADDGYSRTHEVAQSTDVQSLRLDRETSRYTFSTDIPGMVVLGAWLSDPTGVQLDCMSLRGNSGISHRHLNARLTSQMRQYVDYDLIVLEFGINALSSQQSDYTTYARAMAQVINNLRSLYPEAVIMMFGIGDRGQKHGTEVGSMATATAMTAAQRQVARATGALFWDMRAAMGGDGAAADWHRRGMVNADYIHLNHKGGRELATIFVKSLKTSIGE